MASHLVRIRFAFDPAPGDTLRGMDRALGEAWITGRLTWSRYQTLRDTLPHHVALRSDGSETAPDGACVLRCYLDPSPAFLDAVVPHWAPSPDA